MKSEVYLTGVDLPEPIWPLPAGVAVRSMRISIAVMPPSFDLPIDDYWDPLPGGQAPVGVFVAGLRAARRERLRMTIRDAYLSGRTDGRRSLAQLPGL